MGNPGRPVLLDGQRGHPRHRLPHLPDPVAEAIKCLVTRIVEMEQELDEIHPERKESARRRSCAQTQRILAEVTNFGDGAGI